VVALPDVEQQIFAAAFDGRWLVFSVWDHPDLQTSWTMYAWDSTAAAPPRALGRAEAEGVFPYPLVDNGRAFWTLAGQAHHNEVHVTELATGQDRVLDTGWDDYPFRHGSLVVWPRRSDSTTTLRAASIDTGEAESLPGPMQVTLAPPVFVAGDTQTFAWVGDAGASLHTWHDGAPGAATIVANVPQGQVIQWPQVAGPFVTWDNGSAQFVADLRSGSYAQITPAFGATLLSGDALVVTYAPTSSKGSLSIVDSTLIRPSQLPPLPTCP
jgi:hypothetical protein